MTVAHGLPEAVRKPPLSVASVFFGLVVLIFTYTIAKVVYAIFLSPFRAIPGPFLAKLTGNWILFVDLAGNRAMTIHALHRKHGPVVQLGPNELSFCNKNSIESVYGQQSEFRKAPFYDRTARKGIFSMQVPNEHRERRRRMNHVFSQASINDTETSVRDLIKKIIGIIDRHVGDKMNIRHWFRMLTLDLAGAAFLGVPFGGLDSDVSPQYVVDFDTIFLMWSVQGTFPLISWIARQIPYHKVKWFYETDSRLYQYGIDAFQNYVKCYGRVSKRKDLLTKMIGDKEGDPNALTDDEISIEISNLVFAATDTTSLTLMYLFWELGGKPELQKRLRDEVRKVPVVDGVPLHKDLANLPFLNACIMETLRHWPATAAGLVRLTPPGGSTLGGVYVPERTIVSVNMYTIHHDKEHFANPETWDPTRWLDDNGIGGTPGMKELYMPFSKGTRNCIGRAMALFNMRLTVAAIARKYCVTVDGSMKEGDMDITDHFVIIPKGQKCLLRWTLAD